jgi:hypothetical protein
MAEKVHLEHTIPLQVCRISSAVHSTICQLFARVKLCEVTSQQSRLLQ